MSQFNLFKAIVAVSVTISLCIILLLSPNDDHSRERAWQLNDANDGHDAEDDDVLRVSKAKRSFHDNKVIDYNSETKDDDKRMHLITDKLTLINGNVEFTNHNESSCLINLGMIFTIKSEYENIRHLNVNSRLNEKFRRSLSSIFKYSSVQLLCLYIITDKESHSRAKSTIAEIRHLSPKNVTIIVNFANINYISKEIEYLLPSLRSHFTYKPNSYYSHSLFFISLILHRVFNTIDKMIILDIDVQLNANITDLHNYFNYFTPDNVIGIAYEQQPVYRHLLHDYRRKMQNKTRFGNSPPNGIPGFNSGVLLLNLKAMRDSNIYNKLLIPSAIDELSSKYTFHGHLGDQDFYTLISFDNEQLFHVIPCQWNRQLCQWWRYHGYANVFDDYNRCESSIKLFHGNCNSVMPNNNGY